MQLQETMKKKLSSIKRADQSKQKSKPSSRITNQTIAEHRERILAEGRRFKYPLQYARHKLVINAILVVVAAAVIFTGVLMWLLYGSQSTASFTHKITQIAPLPVAKVDGVYARYSDYLSYYNMSTYYLTKNEQFSIATQDGQAEAAYFKRQSLDLAIENAYAKKLAKDLGVAVSDEELSGAIKRDKQTSSGVISDDIYERSAQLLYDMNVEQLSSIMRDGLLRRKVKFAVDQTAKQQSALVESGIDKGEKSIGALIKLLDAESGAQPGVAESVTWAGSHHQAIVDLAEKKVGEVYGPYQTKLEAGEGYYFIKPTDISNKTISYQYVYIPLSEFDNRIDKLRNRGSITEYIRIEEP